MADPIMRVADLRQQVYEHLKDKITRGDFPHTTKFQEIALAGQLGVSRTPVREALAMLVRDGLLMQQTRGFRFPQFTAEQIAEIIEIRLLLEPHAVGKMVEESDPGTLKSIAETIRAEVAKSENGDRYIKTISRARELIFSEVSNRELVNAITRYEDSVHYLRIRTLKNSSSREISMRLLLELADAIAAKDKTAAQKANREQLIAAQTSYLTLLEAEAHQSTAKKQRKK